MEILEGTPCSFYYIAVAVLIKLAYFMPVIEHIEPVFCIFSWDNFKSESFKQFSRYLQRIDVLDVLFPRCRPFLVAAYEIDCTVVSDLRNLQWRRIPLRCLAPHLHPVADMNVTQRQVHRPLVFLVFHIYDFIYSGKSFR